METGSVSLAPGWRGRHMMTQVDAIAIAIHTRGGRGENMVLAKDEGGCS